MTLVKVLLFCCVSLLMAVNIRRTLTLLCGSVKSSPAAHILLIFYLASAAVCSRYIERQEAVVYLLSIVCYYALLFAMAVVSGSGGRAKSLYITATLLAADSIFQSLGCMTVELFTESFDRVLVLDLSSLLFNILAFTLLTLLLRSDTERVRESVALLPRRLYVMILAVLFIIGELCGNMSVGESELFFGNRINSFLTVLTIVSFLVVLASFVFSSISQQYFENITRLMQKQMSAQIRYYERIDRLNEDMREFKHNYKNHMLCLQGLLEKSLSGEALDYVKNLTQQEIITAGRFFSGNAIADSILTEKAEAAAAVGASLSFSGCIHERIPSPELCTILSNALDNAVEACERLGGSLKSPQITVSCAVRQNVQIMRIINPSTNVADAGKTSKSDKENHGIGLFSIRRTVEQLGGEMSIAGREPEFVLELAFPVGI